jgi:hypothetical protein
MDQNTFIIAAGAVNGGFVLALIRIWLGHRERRAARLAARLAAQSAVTDRDRLAGELQDLRAALDTVAVEVERLGEGQRYLTRVLAERGAPPAVPPGRAAAPPARVITPH